MNSKINFNIDIIIEEYSNYVFKIVDNIIGTALPYQDKEEIVSDVFYLLWKNQNNINTNLKGYLGIIAQNCSYSKLRKADNNLEYRDEFLNSENLNIQTVESDYIISLRKKIAKLSPEEQKIFNLYYVEGYKIKEIALRLEKNSNMIKVKLHRIRKKLKEELK